jgi:hypothetical protein
MKNKVKNYHHRVEVVLYADYISRSLVVFFTYAIVIQLLICNLRGRRVLENSCAQFICL